MRLEFNGRKIVNVDYYMCCKDCPLDIGPYCLGCMLGVIKDCQTGFKYEDNI